MLIVILAASVILISAILLLLSTVCRNGHSGLASLQGWSYAHRGLHGDGTPENSLSAFRRAKAAGFGAELDVRLLADGNLAVFHDSSLMRMTGADGFIEQLTTSQLSQYRLLESDETIPEFRQVLELFRGDAPLIIELKSTRTNYRMLCTKTCEMLDDYDGVFCLESFDPRCIRWLRKYRPDLIRGQLSQNYTASGGAKMPWIVKVIISQYMLNFLTYPDFIAYRFQDRDRLGVRICRQLWKAQAVAWTLRSQEEYRRAIEDGWLPIFEGFRPSDSKGIT